MKIFRLAAVLLIALASSALQAQIFDSSATSSFKGTYYVRQLILSDVALGTGAIGRARSFIGTASLDGFGNYSLSGSLLDSTAGTVPKPFTAAGTFRVSANGLAKMQNPLEQGLTVHGGVGSGAFLGSSTESTHQDMLVMIPAGTLTSTNMALEGSYRLGSLDFSQGSIKAIRNSYLTLTANGPGTFGAISVSGSAADQGNTNLTQQIAGATFSISGQGEGSITFPPGSGAITSRLVTGTKTFYVSADGNLLLGGSPTGFDMLLGIRALPGGTPAAVSGTYYAAGFDVDNSNASAPLTDAFYGSVNARAGGVNLWHQRLNPVDSATYDYTFASTVLLDATGAAAKISTHYDVGAGSKAILIVGRGNQYALAFAVHADNYQGVGVYVNPLGVVSAASYSPVTNSIAPNQIVSVFGSGLSPGTASAQSLPLPTSLSGVQVNVNGRPARLFYVSPTQINALVPSNTPEDYATFQVTNNGVNSNSVTLYAANTAPGLFTLDATGIGAAAALHADYSSVNAANPAKPGEVIQIYLTGLGPVTPPVADGVVGPSSPPSIVTAGVGVDVAGQEGIVSFSGLAPGFVGLYQMNVQIPSGVQSGSQLLAIDTPDAFAQQATIAIAGSQPSAGVRLADALAGGNDGYRPRLTRPISVKSVARQRRDN